MKFPLRINWKGELNVSYDFAESLLTDGSKDTIFVFRRKI